MTLDSFWIAYLVCVVVVSAIIPACRISAWIRKRKRSGEFKTALDILKHGEARKKNK